MAEEKCVVCCKALQAEKTVVKTSVISLIACAACGSWISWPRPTASEQFAIHDTTEYFDHPYFKQRREDQGITLLRCRNVFQRIQAVLGFPLGGARVLDVGCDTGTFLACAAKEYGILPFGVDVSRRAIDAARCKGLTAYYGTIEAIPPSQKFKVITLTDVIEHVPDPGLLLRQVYDRLERGGIAYLQTPNSSSTIYQLGRIIARLTWANNMMERLFPAQHIQYFSHQGLTDMVKSLGFDIVIWREQVLPAAELGVSLPLRLPLMGLQLLDILLRRQILLCLLLRKPGATVDSN